MQNELHVLPGSNDRFVPTDSAFAYATIQVRQPVGHTIEDALRPEYWVHHSHRLKANPITGQADWAGAKLELHIDDHSHYAELYVRAVMERALIVQIINGPHYLGIKSAETTGYEDRWNVGRRGFDVIRKSDRQIVGHFPTRELAKAWIDETLKAA